MNNLANVKLSKKNLLEELQAKLTLLHHKLTQQEILDKIIEYTHEHFDDFLQEEFTDKKLTVEKVRLIKKSVYKGEIDFPSISNDELLYGDNNS
jgi:hypothetical protein